MKEKRFFVEVGEKYIAVRDRKDTSLKPFIGMTGVVQCWYGNAITKACPTCGCKRQVGWDFNDDDLRDAYALCKKLNQEEEKP